MAPLAGTMRFHTRRSMTIRGIPNTRPKADGMAAPVPTLALNDGRRIPQIGYGCWQLSDAQAPDLVGRALQAGYRLIDTAAAYGNEAGVGRGIRDAQVAREEIFLTTKLWNDRQGRDEARRAFDESLTRLGLSYVDLYLIHWPCPQRRPVPSRPGRR